MYVLVYFWSCYSDPLIYVFILSPILCCLDHCSLFFLSFLLHWVFHCCVRAFSSCDERGLLFVAVRGLLIAVASLVVEHGL